MLIDSVGISNNKEYHKNLFVIEYRTNSICSNSKDLSGTNPFLYKHQFRNINLKRQPLNTLRLAFLGRKLKLVWLPCILSFVTKKNLQRVFTMCWIQQAFKNDDDGYGLLSDVVTVINDDFTCHDCTGYTIIHATNILLFFKPATMNIHTFTTSCLKPSCSVSELITNIIMYV